ncbi:hypothetical protein EMN47_17065 [Prolixibacteraceae bacterium JC049]|nr:hypothetical protein [Prolixibacteraceae bacterium JC049]
MNLKFITALFVLIYLSTEVKSQIIQRERPKAWNQLVHGGRFMDRFLPISTDENLRKDTWGAKAVIPRAINNGIEDNQWSYWGGNARLYKDGKYHLFVCRWAEDAPKGHMSWHDSHVVHAISESPSGPYKVIAEIGKGHNPEWYITNSGKIVIYVIDGYYVADNINGPWKYSKFQFNTRDRRIIEGLSNLTFAKREDGSFIMVCRGGGVWISKDGLSPWNQITDKRIYPAVDGHFEDPLIWKTENQYHLIVNDWYGRIAYYLRSKDGVKWTVDPGEAYEPGICKHSNGVIEDWFKFERIKVLQDKYGRATQAHFAVIDTLKHFDLPNDNHSSKQIIIPLRVGKRMKILNKHRISSSTKEIKVLVKSEAGFNPIKDLDINSLRFGASGKVNYGKGAKAKNIIQKGNDAVVTFYGENNGLTSGNFMAKLLGKCKNGVPVFGYSRLPNVKYIAPILSATKPKIERDNVIVEISNFGQVSSSKATIHLFQKDRLIAKGTISKLAPYTHQLVKMRLKKQVDLKEETTVVINKGKDDEVRFPSK